MFYLLKKNYIFEYQINKNRAFRFFGGTPGIGSPVIVGFNHGVTNPRQAEMRRYTPLAAVPDCREL